MKVVGLVGSPRKNGNTAALIKKAMEGAEAKGAETQLFYLNELNLRGCQGCYGCKKEGKCVVKDDMSLIYTAIDAADAVIIGSPIYFGRFSAQLALVMDRMFAYLKPDFSSSMPKGKKYTLVFPYNQPDPKIYLSCINSLAQVLERLGMSEGAKPLVAAGLGPDDAALKNNEYIQSAVAMGEQLATF